jgi:hypothetical protein
MYRIVPDLGQLWLACGQPSVISRQPSPGLLFRPHKWLEEFGVVE